MFYLGQAMKNSLFLLFMLYQTIGIAQPSTQYGNILLNTAKDYRKAEPQVILAADYVYSSPLDKDNVYRGEATKFVMKWMGGTSDYSFTPDKTVSRITNGNNELYGLYFVCLAKYALEKGKGTDREELKISAYALLATYCENPANKCVIKGEIKKLIEAKNQNTLKQYIESKEK
jgi:hypothetical protein